ncbi:UDP-N-acetylmuramoyl-tripeptide--D-alanyl-D-alanine ligase [Myceligenerans pegani]|uniref:UDP-N-acetylmuramoyl-tripeptide--D-alanyl-D-alanine ligase n=1 Tax=Myceligenerans pegani TaxID=2776917 RepID=A0ABR9MYI3_9MICO|nr:UDP-N-acetylmuramoyl-tripeptide--D-alanyl-D-alanine ligase [Myceligenerans sp. TRM 65318]MBE1876447.1 UDP-N-acetylmuramoyl-tripeptide--D-alanyl-D-alanine ligase [Myceligenerans sp. TRM 65318]MBE3018718.1 UDP-N-acetylmuramoyl-tripeptide--D-alanyl-D-alanine ligase [Myceligenerans sp. TRM 65318]
MIELTAAQVVAATGGTLHGDPDARVTGPVVTDSRKAEPGSLFVAWEGESADGHEFVPSAVAAGAVVVLAARELPGAGVPVVVTPDPQRALGDLARHVLARVREVNPDLRVVAVTGSVGKTTTKDLIGALLRPEGATILPAGSLNNEVGLPMTVLEVTPDTRFLVLEMGADAPRNIAYLTSIAPPEVGVVLAVGVAHVGKFGSVDMIARTKGEMAEGTLPGGTVVLNADDMRVAAMAERVDRAAGTGVVTFGTIPSADVRAQDVTTGPDGRASFTLRVHPSVTGSGEPAEAPVRLALVGEHHVSNALAATTVALRLGLDPATIAGRLAEAGPASPHRMAVTERPDGVTVVDDAYNANPDSMRAGLKALAILAGRERRSVAVLGEMLELGDDSRVAHHDVGLLAVRLNIKLLVVVGEGAYHIHEGATQEGSWGEETVFVPDIEAAAHYLDGELRPGDVVLVKSSLGSGLWRLGDHLAGTGEKIAAPAGREAAR